MSKFIIISNTIERITNPFVIDIKRNMLDISSDIIYLIHTIEFAYSLYDDFNFCDFRIRENVYWFHEEKDVSHLIASIILSHDVTLKLIYDPEGLEMSGEVFYVSDGHLMWLLNDKQIYHVDLNIVSKLSGIDLSMVISSKFNFIGFEDIKVLMKEIGLLDEIYSERHYVKFLVSINRVYYVLYHIRDLWIHRDTIKREYKIDNKYDNPYQNILLVEEYLNDIKYDTIDIDKCNDYDLKFDKLPARYNFSGFYSTTGRIYCTSDTWTPLQNIQKSKRDILYAENGCIFVEVDYKSFEFDILCQILNLPINEDPHSHSYDKFVGLPHADARNIGKRINYSFIYGMNISRLVESIVADFDSVPEGFRDTLTERFLGDDMIIRTRDLETELSKRMTNSVVENYFGRHIHVKKKHAVLNNYISSTASDFIYNKFLFILEILSNKNKILLQNHDSILLQLSLYDIENSNIMEDILNILRAPIFGLSGRIDYKYGYNWRDLE